MSTPPRCYGEGGAEEIVGEAIARPQHAALHS